MQAFPGVTCYCCGEELGSNKNCGDKAASSINRSRPPCKWAYSDPSIVQRCVQKAKQKQADSLRLSAGTAVFVPPQIGGYGLRGVISGWLDGFSQYTVIIDDGKSTTGSVPSKLVMRYVDKTNLELYPQDALPYNASVRCRLAESHLQNIAQGDKVTGIIQGAAIDEKGKAIYYDTGPNVSQKKQFFLATDVSLVEERQCIIESLPVSAEQKPEAPPTIVCLDTSGDSDFEKSTFVAPKKTGVPQKGGALKKVSQKKVTGASDRRFGTIGDADAALVSGGWRRCTSKEGPGPKVNQNLEHDDYDVVHMPRDGHCLFHCLSAIVMEFQLEQQCSQAHMRKKIGDFWRRTGCKIFCDSTYGDGSDIVSLPYVCEDVSSIEKSGYGELPEVAAFCKIFDLTVVVISPETQERGAPPMIMNPGKPHPRILLQTLGWTAKGNRERGKDHWQLLKCKVQQHHAPQSPVPPSEIAGDAPDAGDAAPQAANAVADPSQDSSDSEVCESTPEVDWALNSVVYCNLVGKEVSCKIKKRCVNHTSRRVNKYTVEYGTGVSVRLQANQVFWPSRVVTSGITPVSNTRLKPMPPPCGTSRTLAAKGGSKGKHRHSKSSSSDSNDDAKKKKKKKKKQDASSSSSSSEDDSRTRAPKFNYKHDDDLTNTIFWQIASDVLWLHSRNGQKAIWRKHLENLQENGHCLELKGHKDSLKTFIAWAAVTCKARRTSRLAESRKRGKAFIKLDNVDDVAERWEMKVFGDAEMAALHGEKAEIMRDAMCSTASSLDAKTAALAELRNKRYATAKRAKKGTDEVDAASRTPSKVNSSNSEVTKSSSVDISPTAGRASPAADSRADLLAQIKDLTQMQHDQEEKDTKLVTNLFASFTNAQNNKHAAAASPFDDDIATLRQFLEREEPSLCTWAHAIHAALGVTKSEDFKELTVADISGAPGIAILQMKRLQALAKRHGAKQ